MSFESEYIGVLEGYVLDALRADVRIKALKAEISDLKIRLGLREAEAAVQKSMDQNADRRYDEMVAEIQKLTDEVGEAERQRDELSAEVAELRHDIAGYDRSLTALQTEEREGREEASRLRTALAEANVGLMDLRAKLADAEVQRGDAVQEKNLVEQRLFKHMEWLSSEQTLKLALQAELKEAVKAADDAEAERSLLEAQYAELASRHEALEAQHRADTYLLARRKEQLETAESAMATLREGIKNQSLALVYSKGAQVHQFHVGRRAGAVKTLDAVKVAIEAWMGEKVMEALGEEMLAYLDEVIELPAKPEIRANAPEPIRSILREAGHAYYHEAGIYGTAKEEDGASI